MISDPIARLFVLFLALGGCSSVFAQPSQDEDESSRQIVLDRFNKARPFSAATGGIDNNAVKAAKPPVYRRSGNVRLPGSRRGSTPPATEEIGITVWRLRPSRTASASSP